ncbi:MAG: Rap1a/Tai family immunity protein [Alphaproteobacteria bacterium]
MTLFLFSLLVFSTPTNAARFSGQYLLHMCSSDEAGGELTPGGHVACQAYIAGVMDYHALLRSMGTAPSIDFCVPKDVPMNLVQAQVTSHVFRNQKQHNGFIAAPAVALGLFQNYPCE